jgi:hypothetical protein
MSIGNVKTDGSKGNNFPWQLKMLVGQQCACDALQELVDNTDTVEPLLAQILAAIQQGTDYEAALVVDANDDTWLEIRIWNGVTFDPPVYYLAGSNTAGTPVAPITYINPNTYLAQIVSNTTGLATEATLGTIDSNVSTLVTNTTGLATETTLLSIDSNLAPATVIHNTVLTSAVGFVPVNSLRGSVINIGNAPGIWNGIGIPPGITIPWGSVGVRDLYDPINYNATGTILLIEYTS